MATESNGAPMGAPEVAPTSASERSQQPSDSARTPAAQPASANATPANATPPKLSNAELKAKAKAEKAARRAQAKEAKATAAATAGGAAAGAPSASGGGGSSTGEGKSGKPGKGAAKQDAQQQQLQVPGGGSAPRRLSAVGKRPSLASLEKDVRSVIPDCFSHIAMAKRISTSQAHKDVHPGVLALGQQMATFTVRDSIARLRGTLLAFRKVIESYETPKGNSLSRHFVPHVLNPQIDYLTECRPMCFSMGNAIRLLKAKVNKFDIDTPEDEAKEGLLEFIDNFINERITLAELVIARNAAAMVGADDTILTYGRHRLVEKALLQAWKDGQRFDVVVLDDPFDKTGQDLAKVLRRQGIRVVYAPSLGGLRLQAKQATKVLLGAEAIFANGSLYGAAGTCDVAMAAADVGTPVIALCETINFDRDRVTTDALTYNEIDPERNSAENFRLLFDTTRDKYLDVVVTEYESETGNSPAQAVLAILRKQEDPNDT
ncbi:hypothetical protein VTK73DRAFT_2279 [Phialemonium thermophilum]|uniref:Translation initiation factor eIF2B subunit delta n=1 Tax=Phialemonium thermophilum TaxID=223376 RepID=A0ABR3X509_9PEZI